MLKRAITIVACFAAMQGTYADAYPGTYQQRQQSHYQQQPHHHTPKYDFYAGIKGGWGSTRNLKVERNNNTYGILELRDSPVYGAMIGYNTSDYFRADLEIYRRKPYDLKFFNLENLGNGNHATSISSTNVMLNGYLSLPLKGNIVPFISAGVGPSWNKVNTIKGSLVFDGRTVTTFAYQIGAGATFSYDRFNVDGEVKYANKGRIETKLGKTVGGVTQESTFKGKLYEIMFLASVRYNF